jgi:hypothetical protein
MSLIRVRTRPHVGMGAVPDWCDWVPFSSVYDACTPPLIAPGGRDATIPAPPPPPPIDTTPGSPTYGQATVDGHAVDTPCDARRLQGTIPRCNSAFQALNPDCSACQFDWSRPGSLIGLAVGGLLAVGLVFALVKK